MLAAGDQQEVEAQEEPEGMLVPSGGQGWQAGAAGPQDGGGGSGIQSPAAAQVQKAPCWLVPDKSVVAVIELMYQLAACPCLGSILGKLQECNNRALIHSIYSPHEAVMCMGMPFPHADQHLLQSPDWKCCEQEAAVGLMPEAEAADEQGAAHHPQAGASQGALSGQTGNRPAPGAQPAPAQPRRTKEANPLRTLGEPPP